MSTEWDNSAAKFPQCVVGIMRLVLNGTVEGNNNLEEETEASRMEIDLHGAIAPPTRHWLKERYKGAVDEFKVEQVPSVPTAVLNTPRGKNDHVYMAGSIGTSISRNGLGGGSAETHLRALIVEFVGHSEWVWEKAKQR
ncbi:hypothetical protein B0H14DRAFT_2578604 [Mycena olivaceomarginata]|nr:hypothetical protein B0H14DRAFT_2578604 [Mycena olivaceomarginata]